MSRRRRPARSVRVGMRVAAGVLIVLLIVAAWEGGTLTTPAARASRARPAPPAAVARVEAPALAEPLQGEGCDWSVRGLWGEFEPQSALILGANGMVSGHAGVFQDLVAAAHRQVRLIALVSSDMEQRAGRRLLEERGLPADAVTFLIQSAESMWVRDFGPLFVQRLDGRPAVVDLDRFDDVIPEVYWQGDGSIPRRVGPQLDLPVVSVSLCLDGGNLLSNGDGLAVTSTSVLDDNEDRGFSEPDIRSTLACFFGVRDWVCLRPLIDEPTGHVDMFLTFLAPDVAVVGRYDPKHDPVNAAILDEAAELLAGRDTARGPMRVYRIPMPARKDGEEAWYTYTNIILTNKRVLVPTYRGADPEVEAAALALYRRLLPDRTVIGINADSLAPLGGTLHCVSMHVPSFVRLGEVPARCELATIGAEQDADDE